MFCNITYENGNSSFHGHDVVYLIVCCFVGVAVQQIFPKNSSYCCPCPSLDLQCEFSDSGTVITVLWSSGSTATQISSDGRMIDNSIISSGMSNLLLYNESFLDATFRCFPLFLNGTLAESNLFTTPELASKLLILTTCTYNNFIELGLSLQRNDSYWVTNDVPT